MDKKNFKAMLKKFKLLYELNAKIKAFQLKKNINKVKRFYETKYQKYNLNYDELSAVNNFKDRHAKLRPEFVSKKVGELNIFWVGASEAQDNSGFIQALKKLGNVSEFFNCDGDYGPLYEASGLNWLDVRKLNDMTLLKQVKDTHFINKIDVLIGQMWSHIYSEETLLKIRDLGIPIINIAMDDRLPDLWLKKDGYRMGSVGLGSGVDITLTTSPETCKWYFTENMSAIFWPLASDENLFGSSDNSNKDIDILFIGNRYGIRGKLIDYLTKRGVNVSCYGDGWENGYVDADQNVSLSKRAKIILGIGAIGHSSDVYTLKLRDFDALMTSGLYITHRNPDLLKLFKEGKHLECYETPSELCKKLKYYIKHPKKCSSIGQQGYLLAKNKHSWYYRLSSTFTQLGLIS